MLTAIAVTSSELVLPPSDRHTPTAVVLQPPGRQELEAALVDMQVLIEQHGYVIALYPSSIDQGFARRLHTLRSVMESDRIALLQLDLPPLGAAVLARQLRQLSLGDFSPGVLASAAGLLAHYIYAGALLGSVAKLDRVSVSLRSHVTSWVPGAQFGVLAGPTPQLVKAGTEAPPAGPSFATQLTVANGQLQSDWVTTTLARHWRVQDVRESPLPAESPRWWGTSKLIEFAAAISDPGVLYQLVASVRRDICYWCGLEFIGDQCAFCCATIQRTETPSPHGGAVARYEAPASGRPR
ncbi:hypothetical protein ABZW18_24800 [Streptomyces sp. NPDC004647]|uniref:hypothetical protein n=1 Tax=Streptomyces sp. NPDC004647 TaxID=3154671 RepID=UPI0033AB499F